jgi:hypothetical protein
VVADGREGLEGEQEIPHHPCGLWGVGAWFGAAVSGGSKQHTQCTLMLVW